jgi:cell division protein FtsQ
LADSNARTLKTVLAVLDTIPPSLASRIASIGAETQDTVQFTLTSGHRVAWGDATQSQLKAAALEVLLRTPAAEYNVSAPTMPFLRSAEEVNGGEGSQDSGSIDELE